MANAGPPPPQAVSKRVRRGFEALAANKDKLEAMRQNAEASRYFDGSAPKTRERRQRTRAYFELFIETCFGESESDKIWDAATFIAKTKQFLEGVTNVAEGKFDEKVKASTLWGYKHALYWWASVLVKDFNILWQRWHEEVSRHIKQLALQEALSTKAWKKSNLSDSELVLIFHYIMDQQYGVSNLKQHWCAILLVFLTGARPGSFAVTPGYHKGASLGLPGKVRQVAETLRWSDIEFVNMPGGIAVRVTFCHFKGYRDPNTDGSRYDSAKRTFLFLPTLGERLEFDLPVIIFGIAYQRGLFTQPIEELVSAEPSDVFIRKNADINEQPVFAAANQAGRIDPTKPMTAQALNPKLQQLCSGVGLLERNTYYSLRRSAIIETRRTHGSEAAKDLAFHVSSANSLFFYDNVGFGDIDMQQYRMGGPEQMSRDEVRNYFSQANLARYQPASNDHRSLRETIEERVKDELPLQEEYVAHQLALKSLYERVGQVLSDMQQKGVIPKEDQIPTGYSAADGKVYSALAYRFHCSELTSDIEKYFSDRKRLYQALRRRLRKQITEELRKEHRAVLAQTAKHANRKLTGGSTVEPQQVRHVKGSNIVRNEDLELEEHDHDEDDQDRDDDEGVDEEVLESHDLNSREEPECWANLNGVVHIQIGNGEFTPEAVQTRLEFLLAWIKKEDHIVAQSELVCPRCQIDPTIDQAAKSRKYSLSRLNTHMAGSTHTREAQLRRALKMDGHGNLSRVACPLCKETYKGPRYFIKHMREDHPEEMWDEFEAEEDEEVEEGEPVELDRSDDAAEFGVGDGNSDGESDDETDFEGFPSSAPAYEGKGKGRAA